MKKVINLSIVLLFVILSFTSNIKEVKGNGGMSFLSLAPTYITSEATSILTNAQNNIVYAGTWGEGVFRSKDGGETFFPVNNGLSELHIHTLKSDPNNPNKIYAGTAVGVFVSENGGESWERIPRMGLEVFCLELDPLNNIIYVGVYNKGEVEGVYKFENNEWKNLGLSSLTVYSLLSLENGVILAGTEDGLYITKDSGLTWEKTGLSEQVIYSIKRSFSGAIYVATNSGVFVSKDPYSSFNKLSLKDNRYISLAIDPNQEIVYAGTNTGKLFKYDSSSKNSEILNIMAERISSIEVDTNGNIYVGKECGISKSDNGGKYFKSIAPLTQVDCMAVSPSNKKIMYFGTENGIFKSEDGGTTYKSVGLENIAVLSIAINPKDALNIYIATEVGIFKSTDGGSKWENINPTSNDTNFTSSIVIDYSDPDIIYAGTPYAILKSKDGGKNWEKVLQNEISCIAINPKNPKVIYALTVFGGIFKSVNSGASWTNLGLKGIHLTSIAISPSNTNIIYVLTYYKGIYKTTNGGKSWFKTNLTRKEIEKYYKLDSIAIDPQNPDLAYVVGTFIMYRPKSLIPEPIEPVFLETDNGGAQWQKLPILNTLPNFTCILLDSDSNTAYLGTWDGVVKYNLMNKTSHFSSFGFPFKNVTTLLNTGNFLIAGTDNGTIGWSRDNGNFWIFGAEFKSPINTLAYNPEDPSIVFAGTQNGILKSQNYGKSFGTTRNLGGNEIYSIAMDPANPQIVYVATDSGIYKSIDGGFTYFKTLVVDPTTALAIDPNDTSIIYAGTSQSLAKSKDSGTSWEIKKQIGDNIYVIKLKDSNTLFLGTSNGLLVSKDSGENWSTYLNGTQIFNLLIDKFGYIFLATDGGVLFSKDGCKTFIPIDNGLTTHYVSAITQDKTSTIYVGTDGGGIFKLLSSCKITASCNDGGTISPSGTVEVNFGSSQTFNIIPGTGYYVKDVKVDGSSVGAVSTYTFKSVTGDHAIEAAFESITYTLTVSAGAGGTITPSGNVTVNEGVSKTFIITPDEGYNISNVKVDGSSKGPISSYTFTNITLNHTIEATFKKEKMVITLQPDNPYMTVNGMRQEIDPGRGTKPIIIPKWGRTVVPIRAIVEALGGTISWESTTRKVTINFNNTVIELWIDKPQAEVNGETKWIDSNNHDVKPIIINDRTMLPLRFVAESLGCTVNWDPDTRKITITYGG